MSTYQKLALTWFPGGRFDGVFVSIALSFVFFFLLFAFVVSTIEVPPSARVAKKAVPERIAKFISQKPKPKVPPKPEKKPEPPKPKPPKPKPKVERKVERKVDKPLSKVEESARNKASNSGLLALTTELSDLLDTSSVDQSLKGDTRKLDSTKLASSVDTSSLDGGGARSSGGVASGEFGGSLGKTTLSAREVASVKASIGKVKGDESETEAKRERQRGPKVRAEEEVVIVFDQNKGALYALYNRERKKQAGLKGKIVLELTIAPSGLVTRARIVSSELNSPTLERRLLARIKTFKFGEKDVETVTVTFPVEFLPR